MRAIQLISAGNLVDTNVASRALQSHELRVRVEATSICGSDLKNYRRPVLLPQIPGHEFAGRILECGPSCSSGFGPDDAITAFPMLGCMNCAACDAGLFRDCSAKKSLGFQIPGSFAQEVIVDERFAIALPNGLSYEDGALVEHLACGYRLAREIERDMPSRDAAILIIGDGPIALADVQALRLFGYTNLSVLGKHPSRLKLFGEFGACRMISDWQPRESPVDICIYAAAAQETLRRVTPAVRPGGSIYPQTTINDAEIIAAIQAARIRIGRAFAYFFSDFAAVMQLVVERRLLTDGLVTTRVSLPEVPSRMSDFFDKSKHFKVMITPN